jgi:hypothetical protein
LIGTSARPLLPALATSLAALQRPELLVDPPRQANLE